LKTFEVQLNFTVAIYISLMLQIRGNRILDFDSIHYVIRLCREKPSIKDVRTKSRKIDLLVRKMSTLA